MKLADTFKQPSPLCRRLAWVLIFAALTASQLHAAEASTAGNSFGIRWDGGAGTTEMISAIMAREENSPLQTGSLLRQTRPKLSRSGKSLSPRPQTIGRSIAAASPSSVLRTAAVSASPPNPLTVGVSFLGAQAIDSTSNPPDSMGDVGPTQFLVCINGRIRVFDKTGVMGILNTTPERFFASLAVHSVSDPRVRYDRLSQRWFVTAIDIPISSQNNRILVAVSSGPILGSGSSFTFHWFQHNLVTPPGGDTGLFADYPTLGVDRHALYVGVNLFDPSNAFVGTTGYVINKTNLLTGTLTVTAFRQLAGITGPGPYSPQGVDNDDPASTEGYFIGIDNQAHDLLVLRRVSDPGGTPSISGNINLTVPANSYSLGAVPATNSSVNLDDVDNRLFAARMHKGTLWTAHNIQVDATGVASDFGGRDGARWYEITNLTTTPTLRQSGTLFDPATANPASYFIPSCAVSGQGHMAIGSSVSGRNESAEIAVAGRLAGDPLGTLRAASVVQTSRTPYNVERGPTQRWGDYSVMSVDPNDDMTFWTVQEYCNAPDSWGVRVIQLRAPPPATPATCLPAAALIGATNTTIIVTGSSLNGSGFFDPGPDYTNHISATFNDPAITVKSVTYTDPTHVTLSVSILAGATNGNRTLTITNPDGQTVASAPGILTITGQPIIESITESGGTATITWQAIAGRSYRVQYKLNLNASSVWIDLSGDVTATSGRASKIDPFGSATERYYQVILLP